MLRYAELAVVDATHRPLRSWMEVFGGSDGSGIRLVFDDGDAVAGRKDGGKSVDVRHDVREQGGGGREEGGVAFGELLPPPSSLLPRFTG